ncbi:MAG: TRAP transporter TatT component family protein [Elusimicrobia bacterium]|nr:TRAP transporter TatT component family protein [Elusimicrobiota bacterium]
MAVRSTSGIIQNGMPAVFRERDPQFVKEALPGNLQLMAMLIENDSSDAGLLTAAAQGFCGYAFMFLEDENEARASAFYEKGGAYALKAADRKGAVKDGAVDPAALTKESAPAVFWHAFCRAGFINLNRNEPDAIAELPKIMPVVEKLTAVRPDYYYNGAYAILGAYYAVRPKLLGGDPDKAKINFDEAVKGPGADFLLNKYLAAKRYAVAAQDAEFFERTLSEVLSAELKDDETRLANEVAKLKARKLLEKKDELF